MAKKSDALTAFDVLLDSHTIEPVSVCAIVGEEGFLAHEVRRKLLASWSGEGDEASADVLDGAAVQLRDLLDALHELSLFGDGRRVVVLESADPFVKEYREQLEDYVAKPAKNATLILEVASWPGNTRLARAVASAGLTLRCQPPDKGAELTAFARQLKDWLVQVASREFDCELTKPGVEQLLELLPTEPGVLYQEVSRLSLLAGANGKIDPTLVRENVGGWRTRKTWDMIDAAADGRAAEALEQLDRLLAAGEEAHALMPQLASTFRKFAMAVRLYDQAELARRNPALRHSLEQAGMIPFKLSDAERQLRQIGRPRARQLYHWLLAADLATKDYNSSKDRARRVLETLILRLSKEAAVHK
jgi:DNA polymerase-3 subunit delta